jgi:uncharacterized protein with PIN domain
MFWKGTHYRRLCYLIDETMANLTEIAQEAVRH